MSLEPSFSPPFNKQVEEATSVYFARKNNKDYPMGRNTVFNICFLFCILFFGDLQVSLANQEDTGVSFSKAWELMTSKSDALKAAQEHVVHAEYKKESAADLYLPDVRLTASYIYLNDDVTLKSHDLFANLPAGKQLASLIANIAKDYDFPVRLLATGLNSTMAERENFTSNLTATWPIYTGGRITAAQDIASAQLGEADSQFRLESLQQFEHLVKYYFGAVLSKTIYQTRMDAEAGLQKHRDYAILLEKQGQIAKVERMQAEAAYDKAVVERKKALRDYEIAIVALTELLKSEQPVAPSDQLFIKDNLPDLDSFVQKTLQNHPGLDILASKKEQAQGLVSVRNGEFLPTVALFGNYNLYEDDSLTTKITPDWLVGVTVNLPLVDRTGRSGNREAAKSNVRQLTYLTNQTKSNLKVLVEKSYRQTQQALEEYQGLGSSQALAQETVDLRIKAFSQGINTSLDVVDAELFLAQVKTQRAVAMYNYVKALGTLVITSSSPESFFQYQNINAVKE